MLVTHSKGDEEIPFELTHDLVAVPECHLSLKLSPHPTAGEANEPITEQPESRDITCKIDSLHQTLIDGSTSSLAR